jgi:hypothetical protein
MPRRRLQDSAQGFNPWLYTQYVGREPVTQPHHNPALESIILRSEEHRLSAYATLGRCVVTAAYGDSSQGGSEKSLRTPKNQCSIA